MSNSFVNWAIYDSLSFDSDKTLKDIVLGVYGERMWFKGGKREVASFKRDDLLMVAFKFKNEQFLNGVPFHPHPIISQVNEKHIPKDYEGNYTYMGILDSIPIVCKASSSGKLNTVVKKLVEYLKTDGLDREQVLANLVELYEATKEIIRTAKEERKIEVDIKSEDWADKVAEDTKKWNERMYILANSYANSLQYKEQRKNKYEKLLSLI